MLVQHSKHKLVYIPDDLFKEYSYRMKENKFYYFTSQII